MAVNLAPYASTNAAGTFSTSSLGYVAGTLLDNPPDLFRIAGGVLAASEVLPMFGGIAINEALGGAAAGPNPALGTIVTRATTQGGRGIAGTITGFCVFNQAHAMFNTPNSPVPVANINNSVNFVRLNSGARIILPILSSLVSLISGPINPNVSWDFVNQQITTFQAAYAANVLTASTWASTGGGQVTFTTTSAHGVAVGSSFTITGSVPAAYNGTYTAIAGTTGSTLVAVLTANPGAIVTEGTLIAGGGALPVEILDIASTGCMIPSYSAATGNTTWNYNGSCAAVLLAQ